MEIAILVAPTPDRRAFKAKAGAPYNLTVEANDRDTAYAAVVELMRTRAPGAELVRIDWQAYSPWFEACGIFDPDDPEVQEYERILRENRARGRAEAEREAAETPA